MFLKRIEMQGFKSFADKTVIYFDNSVTGIVGPNGCGKSNITDAVRWVLGEQSSRSMRGERMSDVIFSGSADRRAMNMAEVTLAFDNSTHILNSEETELEVTRRLYRDSGDAEYLINRRNVRLRDVVDLFLDTGLGKDSLSIISQGNVISFSEAKPQDRRGIFEEAAGVAKYKKRKLESLSRLERTKNNLDRSQDILNELEKQVSPLKRQAHKAEIYRAKKKRLEEIEIAVLVQEVDELNKQIEEAKKTLFDIESNTQITATRMQVDETRIQEQRRQGAELEKEISALQEALMKNVDVITSLEARRTEVDERRKYLIETGDRSQKIQEIRLLLQTARQEYEDRKTRLDDLTNAIRLGSEKLKHQAQVVFDASGAYESAAGYLRTQENQKAYLENLIRDPFQGRQAGTKAIMENRSALYGILGVVAQEIHPQDGYENAVSEALGGSMYNIVTENEQAARDAIRFLNRNQSGRATFLPLNVLRPRHVSQEALVICQNVKGYLGIVSQFVENDPKFQPIVDALLQNILVAEDMETGNALSAMTNRNYSVVTLNGEVIHRGGSMTGGKIKHSTTPVTVRRELARVLESIDAQKAKVELARKALDEARSMQENFARALQQDRIAAASLQPVVEAKKAKLDKLSNDLALLHPDERMNGHEEAKGQNETIARLNKAYEERDAITAGIRNKREQRQAILSDMDRKEQQLRQLRKEQERALASANAIKVDQSRLEAKIENNLQRLAGEYQLTFEFAQTKVTQTVVENAREEVLQLRMDIERLGNINMEAPEQYNEVNDRYEFLKKQIQELTESRDKILSAIDEMDRVMVKQFKTMFEQINKQFHTIFTSLYGGGRARLVLEDPSDILNTGIDIDAQPPGKSVQNNMLFSGGEKSLIALCVLFAILKVKPVPLVILDEVEAALDQGNVERFAQYLHQYTDRTQFLVVTHRPGTMENCNVLFGVTMQHQGVSQMLKVELKEAVDMAQEPTEVKA